jgi:hypothetical protein
MKPLPCLFIHYQALPNFCLHQIIVSQPASPSDRTSSILEYHLLSIKIWSIWLSFHATLNHIAEGPPLVGPPRLRIQHIRSYPPYLEAVSSIRNLGTCHAVVKGTHLKWKLNTFSLNCFNCEGFNSTHVLRRRLITSFAVNCGDAKPAKFNWKIL